MSEAPSSDVARTERATVVGRYCSELITFLTDDGARMSVRVSPELGAALDLGRHCELVLDQSGRAQAVRVLAGEPASQVLPIPRAAYPGAGIPPRVAK